MPLDRPLCPVVALPIVPDCPVLLSDRCCDCRFAGHCPRNLSASHNQPFTDCHESTGCRGAMSQERRIYS